MKSIFSRSKVIFPIANTNQLLSPIGEPVTVWWEWFSQLIIWSDEFFAQPFHVYDKLQLGIAHTQHAFVDVSKKIFLEHFSFFLEHFFSSINSHPMINWLLSSGTSFFGYLTAKNNLMKHCTNGIAHCW